MKNNEIVKKEISEIATISDWHTMRQNGVVFEIEKQYGLSFDMAKVIEGKIEKALWRKIQKMEKIYHMDFSSHRDFVAEIPFFVLDCYADYESAWRVHGGASTSPEYLDKIGREIWPHSEGKFKKIFHVEYIKKGHTWYHARSGQAVDQISYVTKKCCMIWRTPEFRFYKWNSRQKYNDLKRLEGKPCELIKDNLRGYYGNHGKITVEEFHEIKKSDI